MESFNESALGFMRNTMALWDKNLGIDFLYLFPSLPLHTHIHIAQISTYKKCDSCMESMKKKKHTHWKFSNSTAKSHKTLYTILNFRNPSN
jgi:hypothetical protein